MNMRKVKKIFDIVTTVLVTLVVFFEAMENIASAKSTVCFHFPS